MIRRLGTVVVCLVVIGSAVAAHAASVPVPAQDPFYSPPAGYAGMSNGAVIRARSITATNLSIPIGVHAWQLLFRSEDSFDKPTAEVVTVMVPTSRWSGPGPRPVVSYQTAEDSVGSQCGPSYVIRAGLAGVTSNAAPEVTVMQTLLLKGWAVISTDYEGPNSEFLAAGQEAHAVLDGIRAAQSYSPDGLSAANPVALWGYSGGSFASAWAGQLQPAYAPKLKLTAIAVGGTIGQLGPAIIQVDGSYGAGLVFGALIGLQRTFPAAFTGVFTPAGMASLAASADDCTDSLLAKYGFQHVSAYTTNPDPLHEPQLTALFAQQSPYGHGAPRAPVYDYHAIPDEFVPVATDNALVRQYCAAGVPVETVRYDYGEHNSTLLTGSSGAEVFLADQFAGDAPVDNCPAGSHVSTPPRPTAHRHRKHKRKRRVHRPHSRGAAR